MKYVSLPIGTKVYVKMIPTGCIGPRSCPVQGPIKNGCEQAHGEIKDAYGDSPAVWLPTLEHEVWCGLLHDQHIVPVGKMELI